MDWADAQEYRRLCKELRACSSDLAASLASASPIGLHLFLSSWDDLESGDAPSEIGWAKFMAANDGIAARAVHGWEVWERVPDYAYSGGCFRLFGRGNQRDAVTKIRGSLEKADRILAGYEQLDVPEEVEWQFPIWVRPFAGPFGLGYYSLLQLVDLSVHDGGDDIEVLVAKAGLDLRQPVERDPDEFDFWPCAPPSEASRAGISIHRIGDFALAFAHAVDLWIPDEVEQRIELIPARRYMFRREGDIWHMMFGHEEARFAHSTNFTVFPMLLITPGRELDALELCNRVVDVEREGQSVKEGNRETRPLGSLDKEALRKVEKAIESLKGELEAAESMGNKEVAERLAEEIELTERLLKQDKKRWGRVRTLGPDSDEEQARKKITNNIARSISAIGEKMPRLAEHLASCVVKIPKQTKWVYRPPRPLFWEL